MHLRCRYVAFKQHKTDFGMDLAILSPRSDGEDGAWQALSSQAFYTPYQREGVWFMPLDLACTRLRYRRIFCLIRVRAWGPRPRPRSYH
ncbi:hypothetical protein AVEN_64293-1 [Araneus ventricosus]|uniref:Uncharacterized protein n=1 Tax=Araneus ventricosus TaxID=182803 RepID=A0A4Y2WQN1_ARAVE|nr:hypothetical protein AVEN_64293-1 [Araneus ventricosus]